MDRSLKQNAYYHKVVVRVVRKGLYDSGDIVTKKETHVLLKKLFLKVEIINEATWEYETETGSTAVLTTREFIQFIAEIQQWAAEYLNVYVPDPNETSIINTILNN